MAKPILSDELWAGGVAFFANSYGYWQKTRLAAHPDPHCQPSR